ncbi:unnamed protein product [Victoria cruziana]
MENKISLREGRRFCRPLSELLLRCDLQFSVPSVYRIPSSRYQHPGGPAFLAVQNTFKEQTVNCGWILHVKVKHVIFLDFSNSKVPFRITYVGNGCLG